jgi:biotin carboxylase
MPRLLLLLPTATYRATAFVEAARAIGADLTVASERPSTFEGAEPTNLVTLALASPERAADQAQDFARTHPLDGVLGVDDDTAVVAAAIATRLQLRGNTERAALAARDKHLQRVTLAQAGVRVPRFSLHTLKERARDVAAALRYPCVIKPLRLAASRGVIRADDPGAFVTAQARLAAILAQPDIAGCGEWAEQYLVEDFIGGPEVALEGLVIAGRLHVLAIFDKPDPLDGPFFEETIYVTPSRLPETAQAAIAACAQAAVAALELREGPIHAELRWNSEGAWLIELAARPIGGRCSAALRFGEPGTGKGQWSLEEVIVRHALSMDLPELQREARPSGVMMIPVPRSGTLRTIRGQAGAARVPGIDAVQFTVAPGQTLVAWPEGSRYVGFIFAHGDAPQLVEAALRAAHQQIALVIEPLGD